MSSMTSLGNLSIDSDLLAFVNDELLADSAISSDSFWARFDQAVHTLAPRNRELLAIRTDFRLRSTHGIKSKQVAQSTKMLMKRF